MIGNLIMDDLGAISALVVVTIAFWGGIIYAVIRVRRAVNGMRTPRPAASTSGAFLAADAEGPVAKSTIDALRAQGGAGWPKLRELYGTTEHQVVRARVALALASSGDAAALDEVVGFLRCPPAPHLNLPDLKLIRIREALVTIGAPAVEPLLVALSQGKVPEQETIEILGRIGDSRALDALIERVRRPQLAEACVAALTATLERAPATASHAALDHLSKLQPPRRKERWLGQITYTRDGEAASCNAPVEGYVKVDASGLRKLARQELRRRAAATGSVLEPLSTTIGIPVTARPLVSGTSVPAAARLEVGSCESCGKPLRVKPAGLSPSMSLTCRCGRINVIRKFGRCETCRNLIDYEDAKVDHCFEGGELIGEYYCCPACFRHPHEREGLEHIQDWYARGHLLDENGRHINRLRLGSNRIS